MFDTLIFVLFCSFTIEKHVLHAIPDGLSSVIDRAKLNWANFGILEFGIF